MGIDPSASNSRLSFNKIKMGFVLIGSLIFISMAFIDGCNAAQATCEFEPMPGVEVDIKGSIRFNQQDVSSNLFLNVRGVSGLQTGFHGFHIHENGDCTDPGSHFNPMMKKHGFIRETDRDYHIGDFGNLPIIEGIVVDEEIVVPPEIAGLFEESDNQIIGKSFVLHELRDDLGTGGDEGSEATGNAGTKLGCCVITELTP